MSVTKIKRTSPRISINKLGEYLTGNATNRRSIIKDQKYPPSFKTSYYQLSRSPIVEYLFSQDNSVIDNAISDLKNIVPTSDWHYHRKETNIQALKMFRLMFSDIFQLDDKTLFKSAKKTQKLEVAQVNVSVYPDILFNLDNSGTKQKGALKLYFSKNNPLNKNMGEYIATTVHQWLTENYSNDASNIPYKETGVYDVFSGKVVKAPRFYKRKRKEIKAACQEVKLMWPSY